MKHLITALFVLSASTAQAAEKIAFFGMSKLDESLQTTQLGTSEEEVARLAMIEDIVATRFAEEGYEFVDLTPEKDAIDREMNLAKCNGCDTRIAAKLGADYSLVGEVLKVSNLILAINLQLRDSETGDLVKGGVVDIRSNTDEAWARGIRYILKNRIFVTEE